MVKKRTQTVDAPATEIHAPDVFDQVIADRQTDEAAQADLRRQEATQVVQQIADATAMPTGNGHAPGHAPDASHAAAVQKKKYTPPADPFGFENIKGATNRVQLSKSEGENAWVIRFAHDPEPPLPERKPI